MKWHPFDPTQQQQWFRGPSGDVIPLTDSEPSHQQPAGPATVWVPTTSGDVAVQPGVIDQAAVRAYTQGQGPNLAKAIQRATGWPTVIVLWTSSGGEHGHAYAARPDGRLVDIAGPHTTAEIEAQLMRLDGQNIHFGVGNPDGLTRLLGLAQASSVEISAAETFVGPVLELEPKQR